MSSVKTATVKEQRSAASASPVTKPRGRLREAGLGFLLCALSIVTLTGIFPPYEGWPLAFVCLVPWGVAVCRAERPWMIHWLSFLGGWVFYLINLQWMMPVTGLGYVALAFYLALYWPWTSWAIRTGRRHNISVIWSLPVVWTGCEYLRAWVMSGFPWFFVAHAFYRQPLLIQISDLTGAYGVSFLAVLVNGVLIEAVLRRRPGPGVPTGRRQFIGGVVTVMALLASTLLYGFYRLRQNDFTLGPRIAVIQPDFPIRATPPYADPGPVLLAKQLALAAEAVMQKPDLLVFPESAWNSKQNIGFIEVNNNAVDTLSATTWPFGKLCHTATSAFARGDYAAVNVVIDRLEDELKRYRYGPIALPHLPPEGGPPVTVVVGTVSVETFPAAVYPKLKEYNSALVYDKDGAQRRQRYDKTHLVPFGEIVPFRYGRFHWLYRRLNELSPMSFGGKIEYSLTPGEALMVFELPTDTGATRFGTPICYEDVMPDVVRNYVWEGGQRRVDYLINISNDGWFLHSAELPQHLSSCVFRAVENRIGVARAVNTGISGFIDPNGRLYSMVEENGRWVYDGKGIVGWRVDHVQIDHRTSLYGRLGDWFPMLCLALTLVLWLTAAFERWFKSLWKRVRVWRAKRGAAYENG